MNTTLAIVLIIVAAVVCGVIGFIAGGAHRKKVAEAAIGSANQEATRIINQAMTKAEQAKKEAILEAKDEIHKQRSETEKDLRERRAEVQRQEHRLIQKEENIEELGEENNIIINDNPFAYTQNKREQLITALFNAVKGFEYKAYSLKCQGLPYLETLDKIQLIDKENNTHNSFILRFNYKSPKGLESTIEAPSIIKATVNYQNVLNTQTNLQHK